MGIIDASKNSNTENISGDDSNKNRIISINYDEINNLLFESYKRAFDKGKVEIELENDDLNHLFGVVTKNFSGYKKTLEENIDLALRPLPNLDFYEAFGIKPTQAQAQKMGYVIDSLVKVGDSCVYAKGFDGLKTFKRMDLGKIGKGSYKKSSDIYRMILDDKDIVGLMESVGFDLDKETQYYDKFAFNFVDYVNILREFSRMIDAPRNLRRDNFNIDEYNREEVKNYSYKRIKEPTNEFVNEGRSNLPAVREKEKEERDEHQVEGELDEVKFLSDMQRELSFSFTDFDKLRKNVKQNVVGQDEAIDTIIDGIIVESIGGKEETKPWNYLVIGPTGVGKNYTFETISKEISKLTGLELVYRTVNCSGLKSEGSASQLVGAPMGYIGHDEKSIFFSFYEKARFAPLRLILFDEFEKSNKSVLDVLLPALDKGGLYDNNENYIDLSGSWLAFTSNLGYSDFDVRTKNPVGFSQDKEKERRDEKRHMVEEAISNYLSPEFVNRVNIIHFNYLERHHMDTIFDLEFKKMSGRLADKYDINIEYTPKAKEKIINESNCEEFGARFLKNMVESQITVPLSRRIQKDAKVDNTWGKEMLEYINSIKKEGADVNSIKKSIKEFGSPKLPYKKLYVDAKDDEILVRN